MSEQLQRMAELDDQTVGQEFAGVVESLEADPAFAQKVETEAAFQDIVNQMESTPEQEKPRSIYGRKGISTGDSPIRKRQTP